MPAMDSSESGKYRVSITIINPWKDYLPNQGLNQRPQNNKINVTQTLKFVLGGIENILGKGENAGYIPAFSPFPKCFQKPSSSGLFKVRIVW